MATRKKTAKKGKKSKKTRKTAKRDAEVAAKNKFHGRVDHTVEEPGSKINSGDHVVASIRELSFGKLPETFRLAELVFDMTLSTTNENGEPVHASHNSGVFFYVPNDASLNVRDWVVFDGIVRQHLSLRVEITEVENARKKQKEKADLAKVLADSVGKLPVSLPDPVGAILEIIPAVYGAVLAANGDDQVLKHFTSLHAGELAGSGAPELVEGTHVFRKRKADSPPDGEPFVTLKLRIRSAKPA
jgi:hypothetical protein